MAVPFFINPPYFREKTQRRRKLLENLSEMEILNNCGMSKQNVHLLFDNLEPMFEGERQSQISTETKVLTYLSFMRSGSFQWMVGGSSGVCQQTVSRIIERGSNEIAKIAKKWIKFPAENYNTSIENFYSIAGFPKTVGVIDGTHVAIKAPSIDEPTYVNRKQFHSINVQVIADYNYQFLDIVAKYPGSAHDSFIWRNSNIRQQIRNGKIGDNWLIGKNTINFTLVLTCINAALT